MTIYAGSKILKISFFKVVSGKEIIVARSMRSKFRSAGIQGVSLYKLFGDYDLAAVYEEAHGPGIFYQGVLPHVLNSVGFVCFPVREENQRQPIIRHDKDLIAFTFYKIKPSLYKKEWPPLDLAYNTEIMKKDDADAWGSFGWSDAIGIVTDDSIQNLMNSVKSIINVGVEPKKRVCIKTYSFVGINFDLVKGSRKPNLQNDKSNDLFVSINISCSPDDHDYVQAACMDKFGECAALSIGREDLVLNRIELGNWGEFVRKLIKFRDECQGKVISTSVTICERPASRKKAAKRARRGRVSPRKPTVHFSDASIKALANSKDDLHRRLLSNIYTLDHLCNNDLVERDMSHLVPMGRKLLRQMKDAPPEMWESLSNRIALFEQGINQRLIGSYLTTENMRSGLQYSVGGIQKIIAAAEVIPRSLLALVGVKWKGFVIFETAPEYRHDDEIINLPADTWLSPEEWWGLFHETGHVFELTGKRFQDKHYLRFAEEKLQAELYEPPQTLVDLGVEKPWGAVFRFYQEIVADSFDFRFGFLLDRELYLDVVWRYLTKHHYKDAVEGEDFITRTVSALLVNESLDLTEANITAIHDDVKQILGAFHIEPRMSSRELVAMINRLENFILHLRKVLGSYNQAFNELQGYWKGGEFNKLSDRILNAEIYAEPIEHPHLLILRALKEKNLTLGARIAIIKSLWYQNIFT